MTLVETATRHSDALFLVKVQAQPSLVTTANLYHPTYALHRGARRVRRSYRVRSSSSASADPHLVSPYGGVN